MMITFRAWGFKKTTSRIACRFTDNDTLSSLLTSHGLFIENQYSDWEKIRSLLYPFPSLAFAKNVRLLVLNGREVSSVNLKLSLF